MLMINTINVANAIANVNVSYVLIKPPPFCKGGLTAAWCNLLENIIPYFASRFAGVFYFASSASVSGTVIV